MTTTLCLTPKRVLHHHVVTGSNSQNSTSSNGTWTPTCVMRCGVSSDPQAAPWERRQGRSDRSAEASTPSRSSQEP